MKENFQTKKSLGQNFLIDKNIVNKIVNTANIEKTDNVLEIGPGLGALTSCLVKKANKVLSIELDDRLISILLEEFKDFDNFQLLNKDFLKTKDSDLDYVYDKDKILKVVANLPYYITTPIIIKILLEYKNIDEIYIMVQKEVAQRFTSEYRNKKYGSISVFLQSISDVKYEFTVKKSVFRPAPKIDSAIISLKRKKEKIDIDDIEEFEKFLKIAFFQKRKTLTNNLTKGYNIPKEKIFLFFKNLGYSRMIRPEEITPAEYIELYNKWKDFILDGSKEI